MKQLEAEIADLDRELARIASARTRGMVETETLQRVEEFCSEVATGLQAIDDDGKRRLMELLVERIDLGHDDKLKVHLVFTPDWPEMGSGTESGVSDQLRYRSSG